MRTSHRWRIWDKFCSVNAFVQVLTRYVSQHLYVPKTRDKLPGPIPERREVPSRVWHQEVCQGKRQRPRQPSSPSTSHDPQLPASLDRRQHASHLLLQELPNEHGCVHHGIPSRMLCWWTGISAWRLCSLCELLNRRIGMKQELLEKLHHSKQLLHLQPRRHWDLLQRYEQWRQLPWTQSEPPTQEQKPNK